MKMEKNNKNTSNHKVLGFSLIEMLIVIVVMAIVIAMAVPLSVGIFGRTSSEIYTDRVKGALELGRLTAMSEASSVFLCPAFPLPTCSTFPATNCCDNSVPNTNWGNNRLLLFASSTGQKTTADRVISIIEAPSTGEYLSSTNGNSIEFQPSGISATAATLYYCATVDNQGANQYTRAIIINMIGRISLQILADSQSCP